MENENEPATAEANARLEKVAEEIRRADTIAVRGQIDIGRLGMSAKEILGHNHLGSWFAAQKFGFTYRCFSDYMNLHRFEEHLKMEKLSILDCGTLFTRTAAYLLGGQVEKNRELVKRALEIARAGSLVNDSIVRQLLDGEKSNRKHTVGGGTKVIARFAAEYKAWSNAIRKMADGDGPIDPDKLRLAIQTLDLKFDEILSEAKQ